MNCLNGYSEQYYEDRKKWMVRNWMHVNFGYNKKVDKYKLSTEAINAKYPYNHENDVSVQKMAEIAQGIINDLIHARILDNNAIIVDEWYANQEILYNKY